MLNIKTYDPQCKLPDVDARIIFRVRDDIKYGKSIWYTGRFAYDWVADRSFFYNDDFEGYVTEGYFEVNNVSEWGYIE